MSLFLKNLFILSLFAIATVSHAKTDTQSKLMKHTLRYILSLDATQMEATVDKEIKPSLKEKDDDTFNKSVAKILSQTVLVHPMLFARDAGMSRLKSRMAPEDFIEVMKISATELLGVLSNKSASAADQATALSALTNLVIESRSLDKEEMSEMLKQIADAQIEISQEAKDYAREIIKTLPSPSDEATEALKKI